MADDKDQCPHNEMTSTFERGPYCCKCNEPLVGFFWPISRNTPAGAMLWALRQMPAPKQEQQHG